MRAFYPLRAREATQIEFEFIFVSRKLQCSVQFKNVVFYFQKVAMFGTIQECRRTRDDQPWPQPRSGHRMCADENYVYVFGGKQ